MDNQYTMENKVGEKTMEGDRIRGVPVRSQGLVSLIQSMGTQPLFQNKDFLFKNGHITLRCPLTKEQLENPPIEMPWLEARVVQKLNHSEDCYLVEVLGHGKEIVGTSVANLESGAAWNIKLDVIDQEGARSLHEEQPEHPWNNTENYPLVAFGQYKPETVSLYGGFDSMPD